MTTKVIHNFPRYTISDKCEVYDTKKGRVIKQSDHKQGYKIVSLRDDNAIYKIHRVHRLMYEIFGLIEGKNMPDEIDHIDGNPANNLIANLRPATSQENKRNRKCYNKLGYKNIYATLCRTYIVHIKITADVKYTKTHKTLQLAIDDAIRIRELHHGDFANHG